ncbi:NADP-dependent oxidoreductase [Alkalibacterium sp. MB6]|uniref:NADP-dependent oxidoreductase n=1 Tax=Alkalibacterium sp. MB6 TaxID=2081965 RepID=UPI00137AE510|nr:NADP-dependent oxidoreductase [Alkalibacterium sp. MB6]
MKAIVIEEFGTVDQLVMTEIDRPVLKDNRLLVEVHATSVNPVDTKRRKGLFGGTLPMIVGGDVAGVVVEVGSQVTGFTVGDRIMANGARTYAEIVSVNPDRAVKLADHVSFEETAAIPLAGQTAYEAIIKRGQVSEGDRVLIHAGAGGVGSLAIQLAKIQGAYVSATAGPDNQELLKMLGVDHPINYREKEFAKELSDIDFVLDTLGGDVLKQSVSVLKEKGHLLSIAEEPDQKRAEEKQINADFFSMSPTREGLEALNRWLTDGKLKPILSKVVPFTEEGVRDAHELSETGHVRGKIIIKIKE